MSSERAEWARPPVGMGRAEQDAWIAEMLSHHYSAREIARRLHVSEARVSMVRRRAEGGVGVC